MKRCQVLIKANMQVCRFKSRSYEKCHKMKLYYDRVFGVRFMQLCSHRPQSSLHSNTAASFPEQLKVNSTQLSGQFTTRILHSSWVLCMSDNVCEAIFRRLHTHTHTLERFMHPTAGAETQWIWYLCECPRCRFIISRAPALFYYLHLRRRAGNANLMSANERASTCTCVVRQRALWAQCRRRVSQQKLHAAVLFFFEVWGIKRSRSDHHQY